MTKPITKQEVLRQIAVNHGDSMTIPAWVIA